LWHRPAFNNSVVVVTDETDKVLVSRRCPNDLQKILALLAPYRDELTGIVVESTYNWYWLVDGLMVEGYDVKLANTVAMKRYDGLNTATTSDAAHLAHYCGWHPSTGHIHPPAERLARSGQSAPLVRSRTQHVLKKIISWQIDLAVRPATPSAACPSDGTLDLLGCCPGGTANPAVIATLNLEIGRIEARLLEGAAAPGLCSA
jgi:hypothetical protein